MTGKILGGKVAIVTGASKGIGAEIACQFAEAGAAVVVNYSSSREDAEHVVERIAAQGGRAIAAHADIADDGDRKRLLAETKAAFGRLDILVNNAGVFEYFPLAEITADKVEWMFRINVFGLLLLTRDAVSYMSPDGGSIINISSLASTSSPLHSTIYSATKAAVDSITKSLATELGPKGIRVNAIRPGAVETEGTLSGGLISGDRLRAFIATTPLGRVGLPGDIAPAAVFLASDSAGWMTGETLLIAGGRR